MIRGHVDQRLQARVVIEILSADGRTVPVDAIIDTGFSGFLTLSAGQLSSLALQELGAREARLGDGELVVFRTFLATVRWHDRQRTITVLQSDAGALIGMALLRGDRLTVDVLPAGAVSIENHAN
jgi:clan AA aspartic protease